MKSLNVGCFVKLINIMKYCKTMSSEEKVDKENPTFTGENWRKLKKSHIPVTFCHISEFLLI